MDTYIEVAYKQALKSNINNKYGAVVIYRKVFRQYLHSLIQTIVKRNLNILQLSAEG